VRLLPPPPLSLPPLSSLEGGLQGCQVPSGVGQEGRPLSRTQS
jgi:hypothetical protein